ncbi:MAG: hypothetical protein VX278_05940 [Myxococcota bacterium]|nr:hypothetical protein [Myxococcota bacterium]
MNIALNVKTASAPQEAPIQKCPNCKKLIHIPKEESAFVICPYCGKSSTPLPPIEIQNEEDPSWKERPSRLRLIALAFLFVLVVALLYVYWQTL